MNEPGDQSAGEPASLFDRRLRRLVGELIDEEVPLPHDGPAGVSLLAELTYARRPPHHEGRVPGYGALVFSGVPDWDASPQEPLVVPAGGVEPKLLRRYADGRSSFTVVTPDGIIGLAGFEHSAEDELSAVRLQRTGAVVVQRTDRGFVRVCAPGGVVVWTGSQWMFKPLAEEYLRLVERLAPHADHAVLSGLMEFAVHSLAAHRIGATLVWNLDAVPPDNQRDGLAEMAVSVNGPGLSVARRGHFSALRSALAQVDLAAVVGADGRMGPVGVRLGHTNRAGEVVPATGGARHTSARRFSFDVPSVLVVVVSASGQVTVFSGGAVAAELGTLRETVATIGEAPILDTSITTCTRCGQRVLIERSEHRNAHSRLAACPVCDSPLPDNPAIAAVLGVPTYRRPQSQSSSH